jgi:hypothetical protein
MKVAEERSLEAEKECGGPTPRRNVARADGWELPCVVPVALAGRTCSNFR